MINYTPHTVTVRDALGIDHIFPPSGIVPRVAMVTIPSAPLEDGTPVITVRYGDARLPEGHTGPCIVSTMFADAYLQQHDNEYDEQYMQDHGIAIFVPDSGPSAIRENGQIVAVRSLIRRA